MFRFYLLTGCLWLLIGYTAGSTPVNDSLETFAPDHPYIQYTGRIDFSNPKLPRFWQPGVCITIQFVGRVCEVVLNDEVLWGKNQNYIQFILDNEPLRLQTESKTNTFMVGGDPNKIHRLVICKATEANIGYLELVSIRCRELVKLPPAPDRKIEFIGNSITCGTGSDLFEIPCGKGEWYDQHNAWLSYGPVTARALDAQFHLSSVSGIGLMKSCCGMDITMPQVIDKISMRNDTIRWDFSRYQPDVLTICLGQNDGIQDSSLFVEKYIEFVGQLRGFYPQANIICLSSPMADPTLAAYMKKTLETVVSQLKGRGDNKVHAFFFAKQYHNGCDGHPDLAEHGLIAGELTSFIKQIMKW